MPEARVTVPELRKMVRSVKRFSASQAELRARREAARAAAAQQQAARAAAAHAAAASHYAYKQAKHRAQNNAREAAYKAARIAQWEADERARQDFLRATAAAHAQQGSTNAAIVKKRQIYAQQADQVDQHSESDIPYAHSAEAFATGDSDDADGESESEMDGSCEEDSESWDSGSSCQVPIEDTSARAAHVRSHPCDLDHDFPSSSFSANSSENGSPVDWSQHPIAATPARVRRALISDGSEYELQSQDFAVGQEDVSIVPVQSAGRAGSSSHVHQDMHATESGESCPSTPCAQPVQTASNSPTSNQSPRTSDQRVMSPDSSSSRSGSGGSRRSSGSYTGLPPTPQFNPQQTYAQAQVTAGKGKGAVPAPFAEDAITGQQVVQVQVAHMPDTRMDVDFGLEALAIGPHGAVPKLVEDHDIPIQSLEPAGPSPPLAEGAVKIQKRRNVDGYVPAASRWVRRGLEEHRLENSSASRSGLSSGDETSSVNACTGRDSTMSFVSNALAGWDLEGIPANVFEPAQLNTPQPPQSGFAPFQHGAGRFCTMPSRRVRQPPYPKLTQASRQRRQVLPSPFGSQQSTFSQATPY